MARVTEKEKEEFHTLLDISIIKLDSDKNKDKPHWIDLDLHELKDMLLIEVQELNYAVNHGVGKDINTELDDIINIAMFAKHNLHRT